MNTLKDIYEKELIVGSTGVGNQTYSYPKALNALLGMKFKIILGFQGTPAVFLAMERGEIDGICQALSGVSENRPDWIAEKKVAVLFHGGAEPNPQTQGCAVRERPRAHAGRQAGDRIPVCWAWARHGAPRSRRRTCRLTG